MRKQLAQFRSNLKNSIKDQFTHSSSSSNADDLMHPDRIIAPQNSNKVPTISLAYQLFTVITVRIRGQVGCTFQISGGFQGRRTGVGVTTVSNSLILGGWVTKVLRNGDKK